MKRSGTRRPWLQRNNLNSALKVRNTNVSYFALSELYCFFALLTRGDAPHVVRRLPLAIIFRAFGADIFPAYFAPLALGIIPAYSAPLALGIIPAYSAPLALGIIRAYSTPLALGIIPAYSAPLALTLSSLFSALALTSFQV